MNKKVIPLCFFILFFEGAFLYAQNSQPLSHSFYVFRDAVYMQNANTVQIAGLYTAARDEIEQTLAGVNQYIALSRCAYLAGLAFHAEGRKTEAAAYYEQGIVWAEDSLSITPTSEGYQYLAANIALICLIKPMPYGVANFKKIDENTQKALALNPRNLAAQYLVSVHNVDTLWTDFLKNRICVPFWYKTGANARSVHKVTDFVDRHYLIAAKYILAPWPVENMKKGAILLREIIQQDINLLEKEELCNIYLAMALICKFEKKPGEEGIWQGRAFALYPTNRFRETLLRQMGK